jgi:hypothetical protein
MQWDAIAPALYEVLAADAELVAALGGAFIYPAQSSRPAKVPSVEYIMLGDVEREIFNRIIIQFDFWARGLPAAAAIEFRLRCLADDVAQELQGIPCSISFVDATTIAYPADPGVLHRAIQMEFEIVRRRYATPTEES